MQGSVATDAQPVIQVQFLKPDSALVRTALDLLATHVANGAEGESAPCGLCGLSFPCPTVQHARQVVNAGGVLRLSDRPVEGVPDGVVEPASDGPVERAPDIAPQVAPDIAEERTPDCDISTDDEIAARDPVGAGKG